MNVHQLKSDSTNDTTFKNSFKLEVVLSNYEDLADVAGYLKKEGYSFLVTEVQAS